MSEEIKDQDLDHVKAACRALIEHFDSVQIFVTRSAPELEGTVRVAYGAGNWYARYGQVTAWKHVEDGALRDPQRQDD